MGNSHKITGILLVFLVLIAIMMQMKLFYTFIKNKDALDADPLVYGANRYGIESCVCAVSETTSIAFDKNSSRTIVTKKGGNIPLNFSWGK